MGTAMRATGDSPDMIRALGVSVDRATIFGLAMSNGLIALCGAMIAQYQGFADVQMGIGMVVLGIASVIIGEALVGSRAVGLLITGTVMGSVLFRQLVAIALRWGLSSNDLKLIYRSVRLRRAGFAQPGEPIKDKPDAPARLRQGGMILCSRSIAFRRRSIPVP
jgi:ABC-type uncharacterized transport system permease subunit